MKNCVFCQIVSGKASSYKVYEDNDFLAFLDIFPAVKGHTLVIPKKHYLWVYEVPEFDKYWLVVLKITRAIQATLKPVFITYLTYGLQVPHAHIHIMPRYEKFSPIIPQQSSADKKELEKISQKIREGFLKGCG